MSSTNPVNQMASIDAELADKLQNDDAFRRRYIRFWAQTEVASEIKQLRKARRMLQADVAKLAETGQSAISRIEKAEYDAWTFKTLIRIAEVLRARLRITFEPIETVVSNYRDTQTRVETGGSTADDTNVAYGGDTCTYTSVQFSGNSGGNWVN